MLDDVEILEFIKRLDNDETLEKSEINLIVDSFKDKIIKNMQKNKKIKKIAFDKIIPVKEYDILLKLEELELEFDINEFYMNILFEYKYQLYIDETGDKFIVKIQR